MACNCIRDVNEKLAPDHALNATMSFRTGEQSVAMIDLIRRPEWKRETRRGKPGFIVASFCPFCGTRYTPTTPDSASNNEGA